MQPDRGTHETRLKYRDWPGSGLGRIRHFLPFQASARVKSGNPACGSSVYAPAPRQRAGLVQDTVRPAEAASAGTGNGTGLHPVPRQTNVVPWERPPPPPLVMQKDAVAHDTCWLVRLCLTGVHLMPSHVAESDPPNWPVPMQNEELTHETPTMKPPRPGRFASRQVVPFHASARVLMSSDVER